MTEEFKKVDETVVSSSHFAIARVIEVSNRLYLLLIILLIGVLVLGFIVGFATLKQLPDNLPREITVSAVGRSFVVPDIALVRLGVQTEGMQVDRVVKENTEKMNAILKEIKDLGIEEKDIQTTNYNLAPRYEWPSTAERVFKGYTLTQEIRVKIRDFKKIGEILETGTNKGANLIGDLQFTIDDPEKIKEGARKEAIEKAKAKASQLANQSGLKLGKLIDVYEESYSPYSSDVEKFGLGGGEKRAVPEIQPGEQEVTVIISLVYRIR